MASSARRICRLFTKSRGFSTSCRRSIDSNFSVFQEGDRVFVNTRGGTLTKPLKLDGRTDVRGGFINHNDIIGKKVRDTVKTHNGVGNYRLLQPSLEDYVNLTGRLVTPVYAHDANLLVSLLDIHVPGATANDGENVDVEPLEILEAGTGHGSLTLHLARAINGANTQPPSIPHKSQIRNLSQPRAQDDSTAGEPEQEEITVQQEEWDAWRSRRRAVLHSVERLPKVSSLAEKNVRGFRRGMYAGTVDFYVSSVEDWIETEIARRSSKISVPPHDLDPFLTYAVLDMPSPHTRLSQLSSVLKSDGIVIVFVPSITQIGDCVQAIQEENIPLILTKTVELGTGISGGRIWDVRSAVVRSTLKDTASQSEGESGVSGEEAIETPTDSSSNDTPSINEESVSDEDQAVKRVMVCRPKVGERIVGGGFIGVWKRVDKY